VTTAAARKPAAPVVVVVSAALEASVRELNRCAFGMEQVLLKLGRIGDLKQLRYTTKLVNARQQEARALAAAAAARQP